MRHEQTADGLAINWWQRIDNNNDEKDDDEVVLSLFKGSQSLFVRTRRCKQSYGSKDEGRTIE